MEPTGSGQRPFNSEEYEKLKHILKVHPSVPLKMVDQVATAEQYCGEQLSEANYFRKLAQVVGGLAVPLFYKFPVIRTLPGIKRIGVTLLLAYLPYHHLNYLANTMEEKRVMNTYKRWIVWHNAHPKIFA